MAGDAELERLKSEHDRAYERREDARQAHDKAWDRCSAARDVMNRAHDDRQSAHEAQEASWQELQRVRSYNGPRIDNLNSEQETAYQNMKDAFERASAAYEDHDGESARRYADEGHDYKAQSQEAVAERRQLVEEIRDARARHEATKPAFQRAMSDFGRTKNEYERTKADHKQKLDALRQAKAEFNRARNAFLARLEVVRAQSKRRKNDKRSAAERAGVPYQYLDDVWVTTDRDGTVNIYFGGVGKPNGPGHGHYAMDRSGNVTYQRDPYDPHGSQNFSDHEERRQRSSKGPWTPASSQPPDAGIVSGTEGGVDETVSFKVNQEDPPNDDVLIADGDYSEDNQGFRDNHDHSWYDPETGERGYEDRGKYTGPDGSDA